MNAHHLSTVRWPRRPVFVRPFTSLVEDLFAPLPTSDGTGPRSSNRPVINVWSDEHALHVEAELPGLTIEEIELTVLDDQLTLTGARKSARDEEVTMLHEERGAGAFERLIQLPFEVQGDAVSAELLHGVLHVTLPRSEEVKPRRIPVRIAGE